MTTAAEDQLDLATGRKQTVVRFAGEPIDAINSPKSSWEARTVTADRIRNHIDLAESLGQPLELEGFFITDTMVLSCKPIKTSVRFLHCRFDRGIEVDNCGFAGFAISDSYVGTARSGFSITGRFSTVAGDLELDGCRVESGIDFSGSEVAGVTNLDRSVVSEPTGDLSGSDLTDWSVDLTNGKLRDLHAKGSVLYRGLCIAGATVMQLSIRNGFFGPSVRGKALWAQRTSFSEDVLADRYEHGERPVPAAAFVGAVDFYGAQVGGSIRMSGASILPASGHLSYVLRFSHAEVTGDLALTSLRLPRGGHVGLDDCTIGHLEREGDVWTQNGPWEVTWDVGGLTYTRIDATDDSARRWVRNSRSDVPGSFLTLAKAASVEGRRSDELRANIAASERAARPFEILLLGWVRYGFRPYLVALPLLGLAFLCFAQVNAAVDDPTAFAPIAIEQDEITPATCEDTEVTCIEPWLYALDSVLPLDFDQSSTWRPNRDDPAGNKLANVLVANQIAGWLFAGVFVAAVAGKLDRT